MKFIATLSAFIAGAITLVSAEDAGVYFTNPILGTVMNAGTETAITWTVTNSNVTDIDTLELRQGDSTNLALVSTISSQPIALSAGQYSWNIPSNLTTATSYVILARNVAGTSYSAYFTIMGVAPGEVVSSAAPVTSSAAPVASTAVASSAVAASSAVHAASSDHVTSAAATHSMAATAMASSLSKVSSSASAEASNATANANVLGASSGAMTLKAGIIGAAGALGAAALLI